MSRGLRLSAKEYLAQVTSKQPRVRGAKRKIIDGIGFDSTREARRYQDLALMQSAGQIFELRRQVPYPIFIKGIKICDWRADFVYRESGVIVVEDSKGWKTDVYRLKKKMIEAEYGFKIRET